MTPKNFGNLNKDYLKKLDIKTGQVVADSLESGKIINKGLCLHSIRHTYETLVRQNSENNLVAVALSTGHKTDMRMEDHYTHQHKEAIQGIITPSEQLLRNSRVEQEKPLNEANTEPQSNITEDELYQMYLKLKEKFE